MTEFNLLTIADGQVKDNLTCSACDLCGHHMLHTNCMPGIGPQCCDLMFIGRSPPEEDDSKGTPYSGRTGEIFRELLIQAQIPFDSIYISNCLKCCPFDTQVTEKHFKACKGHLIKEINQVKPKALVAIGAQALTWLTGLTGLKDLRKHGLPCSIYDGMLVYPIEQPAALFHVRGNARTTLQARMVDDLVWLKNKAKQGTLNEADSTKLDYKMVENLKDFELVMEELEEQEELTCDLETTSLFPNAGEVIVAVGFSWGQGIARSIPLYAWGLNTLHFWDDDVLEKTVLPRLKKLFESKKFFGHNFVQFDQKWIKRDFDLDGLDVTFDTMIAHYLVDEERGTHGLEQLALKYTTMSPWKKSFTIKDIKKLCDYLHKDVDATWRIRSQLESQLTERQHWLLQTLLLPLGHELMRMEYSGVPVNQKSVDELAGILTSKIELEKQQLQLIPEVQAFQLDKNVTINPGSPKHLAEVMEKYLKLPCVKRTGKGDYCTDEEVLDCHKHVPFIKHIQNLRRLSKLYGTYCEGMKNCIAPDGRIHTSYLIPGTVTGRLASKDPNLQNIPREDTANKAGLEDGKLVKDIFGSLPGYCLLQMDLSQNELRTLAMISGDPGYTKIYIDGLDAHTATAAEAYGIPLEQVTKTQRTSAKSTNFGVVYGMGLDSLIAKFIDAGSTAEDARSFYAKHREKFSTAWNWLENQEHTIFSQGYQETYFGRRRRYKNPDHNSVRQAMNFPIQSTAHDFCLFILVRSAKMLRKLGIDSFPILTVHDSVVYMTKIEHLWEAVDVIRATIDTLGFKDLMGDIPLVGDFAAGFSWGRLKKLNLETRTIEGDE